jgi:hypothetical protein
MDGAPRFLALALLATLLLSAGCAARGPQTWRLVPQDRGQVLVPPRIAAPAVSEATFAARVPSWRDPRAPAGNALVFQKRGKRIRVTVAREALLQQPAGWLAEWTASAEAQGCLPQGTGLEFAMRILDSVPLDPSAAYRLLHAANIAKGYEDLGLETRLQVVSPIVKEGADPDAPIVQIGPTTGDDNHLNVTVEAPGAKYGTETAWYTFQPRADRNGANDDRGPQPLYGRWQTRSPFWWEGPDGAKVLMAYTRQYSNLWFVCGLPPREAGCRDGLPTFLQTFESPGYRPDAVLMFGSQLENTDLIPGEGEFVRAWNAKYAWPRLQLATFRDYFEMVEKKFGDRLETVRGDFGPYWEDGIGTDAQYAALYRETESRALAVEKLSSLAALRKPEWAPPIEGLRRLWRDLILYAEHTYTSSGGYSRPESEQSVRQIETKHFHVSDARETAHWIAQESMSRLLDSIRIEPPAMVVFNTLAHERSGLVEIDLSNGSQLVDTETGQPAALESLRAGNGYRRVRFLAARVPAMGYRVYRIESGPAAPASPEPKPATTIENEFYRVTVDPNRGGVSSIFDKQAGRELVDSKSPYVLDQYVYVAGGDNTRLIHISEHLPNANLTVSPVSAATSVNTAATPWGQSLNYRVSGMHAPWIDVEIRLSNGERRIEILNRLRKEPVNDKEAIYFAFPFAARQPEFGLTSLTPSRCRRHAGGGPRVRWFTK